MGRCAILEPINQPTNPALFEVRYEYRNIKGIQSILITPKYEIVLSPDDETRKMLIPDLNILDVNWYFSKLLPALLKSDFIIERFSYSQY